MVKSCDNCDCHLSTNHFSVKNFFKKDMLSLYACMILKIKIELIIINKINKLYSIVPIYKILLINLRL